jgi:dTDP-4-dehydrorhamnose reductase
LAKIAITGSTGFVGSNIASILMGAGHEVIGLGRRVPAVEAPWVVNVVNFDDIESIAAAMVGVDVVIHCAIANEFNRLVADRLFAYDSLVGMTNRVVRAANIVAAKPIYISTDWVMDGSQHKATELDYGNSVNFYGFLKALGEQVMRDLAPTNGAICRIAGVMGRHQLTESPRSQDVGFGYFVHSLVEKLSDSEEFEVWGGEHVNQITTPSLASEIGAQIERVIAKNAIGTFHLVCDDAVSRMELANLVCEVFELDSTLIREIESPEAERFPGPVPVDSSLDNRLTKMVLELEAQSIRQILEVFRTELESNKIKSITQPLDKVSKEE